MADSLDLTWGAWLIALLFDAIFYGCGLLQTWLYFHWYPQDRWWLKVMVLALLLLETVQLTAFFAGAYIVLIHHFGDSAALTMILWVDTAQLLAGFLSEFLVQMYFAYCVFTLDKKNLFPPIIITVLALLTMGAGAAQTILSTSLASFARLDKTKPSTTLQGVASVLCDVAITISLSLILDRRKSVHKTTDSLIKSLMINAINRGLVTSFFAALNLILFLALPGTFVFFIALIPTSKLYMNTCLATLNSRQHIKEKSRKAGQSIQLQSVITTSPSISFNSAERSIQVYNGPSVDDSATSFHSKINRKSGP